MKERTATLLGLLAAPVLPALVFALGTPVTSRFDAVSALGLLPIGYLYAAAAAVVFGLPLFLLVRALGLVRWWTAALGGFFIGGTMSVLMRWSGSPDYPWAYVVTSQSLMFGVTGAAAALTFWLVWKQSASSS